MVLTPVRIAVFDEAKIQSLMLNSGIIRNNQKIRSTINNAQQFLKIQEEFGSFSDYIWRFVGGEPIVNIRRKITDYPSSGKESDAFSKDLKQRGFKFLGTTVCYSHMQAIGMVNDYSIDCFRRAQIIGHI